tara:strand:+ start:959 stop:1339 length:381 start_codon:yes stop_codon:yes gene_type:complete
MSQSIIVDACGWVAVIDSGINIDLELEKIFGTFELILLKSVLDELKEIENDRPKRKTLLIPMLESKSKLIENNEFTHTDDKIYSISEQFEHAVLTVDKELKKRLYKSSIKVIEVNKNNHLNVIENL